MLYSMNLDFPSLTHQKPLIKLNIKVGVFTTLWPIVSHVLTLKTMIWFLQVLKFHVDTVYEFYWSSSETDMYDYEHM